MDSDDRTQLTQRQHQIMQLVAQGMSNEQIGKALFLSEHTVKTHLLRAFRELGVTNRAAAIHETWRQMWAPNLMDLVRELSSRRYPDPTTRETVILHSSSPLPSVETDSGVLRTTLTIPLKLSEAGAKVTLIGHGVELRRLLENLHAFSPKNTLELTLSVKAS